MSVLFSTKIIEQVNGNKTSFIREVRFFGWLFKKEEVYTECMENWKAIGFNVFPDQREYVEDED